MYWVLCPSLGLFDRKFSSCRGWETQETSDEYRDPSSPTRDPNQQETSTGIPARCRRGARADKALAARQRPGEQNEYACNAIELCARFF